MRLTRLTDLQVVALLAAFPVDPAAPPNETGVEARVAKGHLTASEHERYVALFLDMLTNGWTDLREGTSTAARLIFARAWIRQRVLVTACGSHFRAEHGDPPAHPHAVGRSGAEALGRLLARDEELADLDITMPPPKPGELDLVAPTLGPGT